MGWGLGLRVVDVGARVGASLVVRLAIVAELGVVLDELCPFFVAGRRLPRRVRHLAQEEVDVVVALPVANAAAPLAPHLEVIVPGRHCQLAALRRQSGGLLASIGVGADEGDSVLDQVVLEPVPLHALTRLAIRLLLGVPATVGDRLAAQRGGVFDRRRRHLGRRAAEQQDKTGKKKGLDQSHVRAPFCRRAVGGRRSHYFSTK